MFKNHLPLKADILFKINIHWTRFGYLPKLEKEKKNHVTYFERLKETIRHCKINLNKEKHFYRQKNKSTKVC